VAAFFKNPPEGVDQTFNAPKTKTDNAMSLANFSN
jgi:hypothetical protein